MPIKQTDQQRTEELLTAYTRTRIDKMIKGHSPEKISGGLYFYHTEREGYVLGDPSDPKKLFGFLVRIGSGRDLSNWAWADFEKSFTCCEGAYTHRLIPSDPKIPFPFDKSQLQQPSLEQLEAAFSE